MSTATRGPEGDEGNTTYPSPGAEAMEVGPFYNTREGGAEHQESHHEQHHDPAEQVPAQEHVEPELHQHQPPPETPQQHVSLPSNLEELQLAAQLGQGMASTPMMSATDPNMNVEDPNLRSIMPHADSSQQQTPSYMHQERSSIDSLVPHGMSGPGGHMPPPQYMLGEGVPPRKRSKVSRACDECRRKKIKCDAQSDTGEAPCSSCARSSVPCLFSRVPQKRGPSKGYIKDLADRIHDIENKLGSGGTLSQADIDRVLAPDRESKKRPISSISGDATSPTSRSQPFQNFNFRTLQVQPSGSGAENSGSGVESYVNGYNPVSLAPSSQAPPRTRIQMDELPTGAPIAPMDAPMDVVIPDIGAATEINEEQYQAYLSNCQPVYPILPFSKARMQDILRMADQTLQSTFINALQALSGSADSSSAEDDARMAETLVSDWERSKKQSTGIDDIVHLQARMMLTIRADSSRSSPPNDILLSRAIGAAYTMRLWRWKVIGPVEAPVDTLEHLATRMWWSLVLMDAWHAIGTGRPMMVKVSSVVSPPGMQNVLGDVCFHLCRLSRLFEKVSTVVSDLLPGTTTPDPVVAAVLTDYVEIFREDLPNNIEPSTHPIVHLAYWHARVIIQLLTPEVNQTDSVWAVESLANTISANPDLQCPLMKHFILLAARALEELAKSKSESTRERALQLIQEIVDKPDSVWNDVRVRLADRLRLTTSSSADVSQGLQQLADVAAPEEAFSLASGYLSML